MSQFVYLQKQAWANLSKKPGFVSAIVATMGITLGTLLCVLTLAYILILSPLPYPKPDSLYRLDNLFVKGQNEVLGNFLIYPGIIELHKNQKIFSETAIVFYGANKLESDPLQPNLMTTYVTPEWFSLLGAKVAMGRVFENTEAIDSNNPVVILSYESWKNSFAGDADILDKKITISRKSFRVIGVLAPSFIEPRLRNDGKKTEIYLPWDFNPIKEERGQSWRSPHPDIAFFGNLSPGLSKTQAEQTLTSFMNDLWQDKVLDVDFWKGYRIEIKLNPFKSVILGDFEKTVYLLLAAVIGLVLIALANISNLFMSRTAEQQRQLAIQAALGATKKKLFRAIFAETSQLMVMAILLAILIASFGFLILQTFFALKLPRVEELSVNGFTFGAAVLIALFLAVFFARLSISMINYRALQSSLHSSGKGSGIQVSKKIRKILIVSQIGIVTSLIFINFNVFLEAFKIINQPIGFETKNVFVISLNTWSETADGIIPTVNEITKKLEELPEVESTSQSYSPLELFDVVPHRLRTGDENLMVQSLPVDNKYFDLIGQRVLEGDAFSENDVKNANKVIVINDVYAHRLAPAGSALGLQIRVGDDITPSTVIGVVRGIKIPGEIDIPARAYSTFSSDRYRLKILVKLKEGGMLTTLQVINVIKEAGGQVGFWNLDSMDKQRNELLFTQFATTITSAILVIISYLLAAIGLYGVLSYGTQLRRFEIGTRMAIGAKRKNIIGLIIKDNSISVIVGFVTSTILLLALYIIFSSQLKSYAGFQLLPIFFLTLILVGSITLLACYWPLRKFLQQPVIRSLRGAE